MSFTDRTVHAGCAACVAVGRMKEAEELIPNMKQKGYRPENRFYNILINVEHSCTVFGILSVITEVLPIGKYEVGTGVV